MPAQGPERQVEALKGLYRQLISTLEEVLPLLGLVQFGDPAVAQRFYRENLAVAMPNIKAGKLRALAITTARRSPALPDVPTISEFVPGFASSGWTGIGAPRGTPPEIVDRLNHEINAAMADPDMKARFDNLGVTLLPGSATDFAKLIAEETEKWAKVVRFSGAKIQ